MATTSKYFVASTGGDNQDLLDFGLAYGNGAISTGGETIQYNGSGTVNAVVVRPGMTLDLTNTGSGKDKIYFSGNLADYTVTADAASSTLLFTRASTGEVVTVAGGTSINYDFLVFGNGFVNSNDLYVAVKNSSTLPTPNSAETFTNPVGAFRPDATLSATVKAFALNQAGETFASVKPGVTLVVNGASGVDKIYVADGSKVDATNTGSSVDLIYLRGNWADYSKSTSNGVITFTRTVGAAIETVQVTAGTSTNYDRVVFADGSAQSNNINTLLQTNPSGPSSAIPGGFNPSPSTPIYTDNTVAAALNTLKAAADANNAVAAPIAATVYAQTNAKSVLAGNVASYNSALDSTAIAGAQVSSTDAVQKVVDAYNAILASADGNPTANTSTPLTGDQYAAVGVTGVSGATAPVAGSAVYLLDNVVDLSASTAVDTVPKLQAMANAAKDVMGAVGQGLSTTVTKADLDALGIVGVTAANIAAIEAAIGAATAAGVDTQAELQTLANTAVAGMANSLSNLQQAAAANTAGSQPLTANDYAKAGLTGVNAGNVASINTALDSAAVGSAQLTTEAQAQSIVNAYNAILASADGTANNTTTPITGDQYAAIGVTGLPTGAPTAGSALSLLDSAVDASPAAGVDTQPEVQALADAANHVITAAGLPAGTTNPLTMADLVALGVTGLTSNNIQAVIAAIVAQSSDANVDTLAELQAIATAAETKAATALGKIQAAADANNAGTPGVALTNSVYSDAGVTGVTTATQLQAVNSALDTSGITGAQVGTVAAVQGVVNAYNAILTSADGTAGNTPTALTGDQYATVGVTGVSGSAAPTTGSAVYLLDNVVDSSATTAVDTVPELQSMATAAAHVIGASGNGTQSVTAADLTALGITGSFSDPAVLSAMNNALHAATAAGVDTKGELQALADTVSHPALASALNGVNNLDVTSNLVLTTTTAVRLSGTGMIHITQTGGAGYGSDTAAAGNSQDIDLSTALGKGLISIDATGTKITINPTWDLDFGANYTVSVDAGAFVSTATGSASAALTGLSFSTVTPGSHTSGTAATEAVASRMMDGNGQMVASRSWLNIEGLGNDTGSTTQLGDLSGGSYGLVMHNYATDLPNADAVFDGIRTHDTNVSVSNFGLNDLLYFDAQLNNTTKQGFDDRYTQVIDGARHGGVAGQQALEMNLTSSPQQNGSNAQILLGLEGNTTNQIYAAIHTVGTDIGWADALHFTTNPVVMG